MKKWYKLFLISLLSSLVYSCSGENFHLRGHGNNRALNISETFYIKGVNRSSRFASALYAAIKRSGSAVSNNKSQASIQLDISNINEGKVAAGYSRARKVREYDIFLKLDYRFKRLHHEVGLVTQGKINVMRTQLYDSDFALGKAEEEETIRQELRNSAAETMLTKLYYVKQN